MKQIYLRLCGALGLLAVTVACGSSPAAPTVTIPGPTPVSPATGAQLSDFSQPVTLTIQNVTAAGTTTALTYGFDVATDDQFANKVFSQDRIAAGTAQTSVTLGRLTAGTNYYWRSRAEAVGVAVGTYSSVFSFRIQSTVVIPGPSIVAPANGATIADAVQPVTLTLQNVTATGGTLAALLVLPAAPSVLTYRFEVATDNQFSTTVATKTGVAAGAEQTSVTLDKLPSGKTYYWRGRAEASGVAVGIYSSAASFTINLPVTLQAPVPVSPADNAKVEVARPELVVTNAGRTGTPATVFYRFEISKTAGFESLIDSGTVTESSSGQTSYTPGVDMPNEGSIFWRVRAADPTNAASSPYSAVRSFTANFGFDIHKVVFNQGRDIADFKETSVLTEVDLSGGNFCTYHTMLGVWPAAPNFDGDPNVSVEGNQWVFVNIDGVWYGGAGDWYKPGQACKMGVVEESYGTNFYFEPLKSWRPRSGELIGVAVSTPARLGLAYQTIDERSNVVFVRWP